MIIEMGLTLICSPPSSRNSPLSSRN